MRAARSHDQPAGNRAPRRRIGGAGQPLRQRHGWPARLRQLSDAADPVTRTYDARYVLEGDAARAPLGATVTVYLTGAAQPAASAVPIGAITDEGKGPGVWVLDDGTSVVSFRPVQIAEFGGESVILGGGVRVGETIVALGGHLLHEGQSVRSIDASGGRKSGGIR